MATEVMGVTGSIPGKEGRKTRTRIRGDPPMKARRIRRTTNREIDMLNTKVVTWSLALFSAVTYLVCVVYGFVVPETLHMTLFLEQVLPGFHWLTLASFFIGLVEMFLYGAYVGLVFSPIYNLFAKRWGAA